MSNLLTSSFFSHRNYGLVAGCLSEAFCCKTFYQKDLYSNQVRIPDSANCKLLLTMGLTHCEPRSLNRYRYNNRAQPRPQPIQAVLHAPI